MDDLCEHGGYPESCIFCEQGVCPCCGELHSNRACADDAKCPHCFSRYVPCDCGTNN